MPTGSSSSSTSASGLNSNQVSATLKPPSLSSSHGNHLQVDHQNRFLAAPSPDVFAAGAGSQRSTRSATGVTNLHQQSTRRTLRNINAIRFLRSIKVDGEPHAFPEADEHASLGSSQQQQQQLQLPPSSSSQSSSLENENTLQPMLMQKKLSSGFADMSGSSPPLPNSMDLEVDNNNKSAFLLQEVGHQRQSDSICCERALSRGNVTPMEVHHHHGSLSSNESPTRLQHDINIIPPTPTLPSTESSKYHHHAHNHHSQIAEVDEHGDPLPFFQSSEDLSPNSTRSPRRASGATAAASADHPRHHHHSNHHHYYQPYHRSPPRVGPHRDVVRVHDQSVRFRHQRDEDLRFDSGDQDISSKSFRLRHASQRDNGSAAGFVQPFLQDDAVFASGGRSNNSSESREISFSDLLVVTANALCRSFTDGHPHPQVTATGSHQLSHHPSLIVSSPQHGSSANGKTHQRHNNQGEIEIRLYEYDPEKLDSPSFLQSVNRCPVVMPSYSVTILGYYDPSSAKKLLNDQFKERFPDIQLTFTKMRSLKREMKKIALKCGLDLWCIAQSYVFFEKLILKHYIKKPNRKLCAGACLLLSAKLNDIRKSKIPTLIQEIESTFRIDKEDLLTCEFNTFLALDFTLMVGDCEVIPHLVRLIEQQHQSVGGTVAALNSTANFALHQHCTSPTSTNYALMQQHMAQHGHVRIMPPNVVAPTSTPSALVTSSGNGSSYHNMAIVPMNNFSVIPFVGKS